VTEELTGRYLDRATLLAEVWRMFLEQKKTPCNIAIRARVTTAAVMRILATEEGKPT